MAVEIPLQRQRLAGQPPPRTPPHPICRRHSLGLSSWGADFWRRRTCATCRHAAAGESIGPSARKKRGPQDDKAKQTAPVKDVGVFRAFVKAGQRLAEASGP